MPKSSNQKMKLFYVFEMLKDQTYANDGLTVEQIHKSILCVGFRLGKGRSDHRSAGGESEDEGDAK